MLELNPTNEQIVATWDAGNHRHPPIFSGGAQAAVNWFAKAGWTLGPGCRRFRHNEGMLVAVTTAQSSMQIAIVTPEFPPEIGGMQTYAVEFARELVTRGRLVMSFGRRRAAAAPNIAGIDVRQMMSGRTGAHLQELRRVKRDA